MAPSIVNQSGLRTKWVIRPDVDRSQVQHNPPRKSDPSERDTNEAPGAEDGKDRQLRSWADVAQGSKQTHCPQASGCFMPQVAGVQPSNVSYPTNHLLGVPQEVRDAILELLSPPQGIAGTRPAVGYENYQLACRQTFHETSRRWNSQPVVLVPANRASEFIHRTLDVSVLHSNAYHNVKSLFLEIRHDAPSGVFSQMAQVLRLSTQLEELHLFGVGSDGYGKRTSSVAHSCGKHDMSIVPLKSKLQIDGQHYRRRLTLVNGIPWLQHLKVLVLDNLNMPLLQAHVLMNKRQLEKLYISADPRSALHREYPFCPGLGLGNLVWPVHGDMPPVKELRVDANAILDASQIALKVAKTLESLDWTIPDAAFQFHPNQFSFYSQATLLLTRLPIDASQLRELRVCVHGPVSEDHYQYGNFMGSFKDCVSRMRSLELVELHMHSKSPWFANEFVEALSPSVTRLYLTDLCVHSKIRLLGDSVGAKVAIDLKHLEEVDKADAIGEDLTRQDYIPFSRSKLGFVGYEYDLNLDVRAAAKQGKDMSVFLKLNGRLLDRERNHHLASLQGTFIPPKEGSVGEYREDIDPATAGLVEKNRKELTGCILNNHHEYFGSEDVAEVVFRHEPVAKGGHYSYPVIEEVENVFKCSNHWLSK
ncbi:hypothetical protein A1O7_00779 [Cladophialophora yegresii CBS 114405]|uniref:Uncharacterized protein n=1 Tax=Cladophialophora yegresii CBS 114405 TaxID=1182544 RepID=W9W934_9EURO|nr:uncharacterized protein A1O7_00779 [Cladophialophora yegresii CBS 114405]EXJ64443.1 hypothetical protein A1O7_00779 [Cladophialophora yegresii CBS 114405]